MKFKKSEEKIILTNRVKLARVEKNLSQGELADMVGASRQTIGAIENGTFNPSAKLAALLCVVLEKKFEDLFILEVGND